MSDIREGFQTVVDPRPHNFLVCDDDDICRCLPILRANDSCYRRDHWESLSLGERVEISKRRWRMPRRRKGQEEK